jgi:hypothetical protein
VPNDVRHKATGRELQDGIVKLRFEQQVLDLFFVKV